MGKDMGLTPDCMLNLPSLEPSQCLSKLFNGDAQSARGNRKNPRMLQRIGQSQEAGAERPSGRWFAPPSTVRPTEEPTSKPSKNRWASKVPTSGIEGSLRVGWLRYLACVPSPNLHGTTFLQRVQICMCIYTHI